MNISVGDCLAENGFTFYEKLHEPIFLINKFGKIIKTNKAGRKFKCVAKINITQIENFLIKHLDDFFDFKIIKKTLLKSNNQTLRLITTKLGKSEYFLVEIRR